MAELHFIPLHGRAKDIAGVTFGRLTAIGAIGKAKGSAYQWLCICDCGSDCIVTVGHLSSGHTKSCGCIGQELGAAQFTTHGMSKNPVHAVWCQMRQRCENPNHERYSRYGDRGITVCDRWSDYPTFISDMGERPSNNHSIERRDNDGNYCPENCSWELPIVQNRNSSHNKLITFNDKTQCVSEWAEEIGIEYGTLSRRINAYGWPIERALTEPVRK